MAKIPSGWQDRNYEFTRYSAYYGYWVRRTPDRPLWVTDSTWKNATVAELTAAKEAAALHTERDMSETNAGDAYDATVLFVHGLGGRSEQFFAQIQHLISLAPAVRYRVVTVDLLGHGRSAKPDAEHAYARDQTLADIEHVLARHRSARNYVVGHSMGAGLLLGLLSHPKRTAAGQAAATAAAAAKAAAPSGADQKDSKSAAVEGLASAPAPPLGLKPSAAQVAAAAGDDTIVPIDRAMALGCFPLHTPAPRNPLLDYCWDWCLNLIRPVIGKAVNRLLYHPTTSPDLITAEGKISSQNPFYVIRHLQNRFAAPGSGGVVMPLSAARDIAVPLYALHGADDRICKAHATAELMAAIPSAEFEAAPETAHNLMVESPDFVSHKIAQFFAASDAEVVKRRDIARAKPLPTPPVAAGAGKAVAKTTKQS